MGRAPGWLVRERFLSMVRMRALVRSRAMLLAGVAVSVAVPALTLPRLPAVTLWPLVLGLVPWVLGKYLLCPLRWRVLTDAGLSRRWHLRAYAESELLGLLTPGHVGADVWRVTRLHRTGMGHGDVVRRLRPGLLPSRPFPRPRQLAHGLVLSAGYQLSIAGLLLGTVAATGHTLSPLAALGAFGASQLAGAVPGPNGASPRDGALVVALATLGVPWDAAAAAVAIKATLAWLPALALGGVSLLLARRALRLVDGAGAVIPAS